jgi:hypothetical protein
MRSRRVDLFNAKSKSGFNVSRIAAHADLANTDIRDWCSRAQDWRRGGSSHAADVQSQRSVTSPQLRIGACRQ